jgi:hypothetical protein
MIHEPQPYGLMLKEARAADELESGDIIVLDGHVLDVKSDPNEPGRVRVVLARALGPPPGTSPDQRPIELICPADMSLATAAPHNVDLAPLPTWSA